MAIKPFKARGDFQKTTAIVSVRSRIRRKLHKALWTNTKVSRKEANIGCRAISVKRIIMQKRSKSHWNKAVLLLITIALLAKQLIPTSWWTVKLRTCLKMRKWATTRLTIMQTPCQMSRCRNRNQIQTQKWPSRRCRSIHYKPSWAQSKLKRRPPNPNS